MRKSGLSIGKHPTFGDSATRTLEESGSFVPHGTLSCLQGSSPRLNHRLPSWEPGGPTTILSPFTCQHMQEHKMCAYTHWCVHMHALTHPGMCLNAYPHSQITLPALPQGCQARQYPAGHERAHPLGRLWLLPTSQQQWHGKSPAPCGTEDTWLGELPGEWEHQAWHRQHETPRGRKGQAQDRGGGGGTGPAKP